MMRLLLMTPRFRTYSCASAAAEEDSLQKENDDEVDISVFTIRLVETSLVG